LPVRRTGAFGDKKALDMNNVLNRRMNDYALIAYRWYRI